MKLLDIDSPNNSFHTATSSTSEVILRSQNSSGNVETEVPDVNQLSEAVVHLNALETAPFSIDVRDNNDVLISTASKTFNEENRNLKSNSAQLSHVEETTGKEEYSADGVIILPGTDKTDPAPQTQVRDSYQNTEDGKSVVTSIPAEDSFNKVENWIDSSVGLEDNSEMGKRRKKKSAESFTVSFGGNKKSSGGTGAKGNASNLQDSFQRFQQQKTAQLLQQKKMRRAQNKKRRLERAKPENMWNLRMRFLQEAKKYMGIPYAKRYHSEGEPLFDSKLFLDCCGLVRKVLWNLQYLFGFRIGPWNQAYMFDTLPIDVQSEKDMKPGDLVFISGIYNEGIKFKNSPHNMKHVEIWLGEGNKTIGARWQKGVISVFDSYQFESKSYHSMQYHFKSIDTWLKGFCKSHCTDHPWRMKRQVMFSDKSIFSGKKVKKAEKTKAKGKQNVAPGDLKTKQLKVEGLGMKAVTSSISHGIDDDVSTIINQSNCEDEDQLIGLNSELTMLSEDLSESMMDLIVGEFQGADAEEDCNDGQGDVLEFSSDSDSSTETETESLLDLASSAGAYEVQTSN